MTRAAPDPASPLAFGGAEAELAATAREWLDELAGERRVSAHTLDAYRRDLCQFFVFLRDHFGAPPKLAAVRDIKPADLRKLSGEPPRHRRRQPLAAAPALGPALLCPSSRTQGPRQCRGLFRAAQPGKRRAGCPRRCRRKMPAQLVDAESRAGDSRPNWILARDAAVLGLLYGAGLRISEALSIKRQDAPIGRVDSVTVTGKGGKTRSVPVIAPVQRAIATYLELCPFALPANGPLFSWRQGRPAVAAGHPARGRAIARRARLCRRQRRHMRCAIPSPRIF